MAPPERPRQLQPVELGEHHVDDGHVERAGERLVQPRGPGRGGLGVVALVAQAFRQQPGQPGVVLHQQHVHGTMVPDDGGIARLSNRIPNLSDPCETGRFVASWGRHGHPTHDQPRSSSGLIGDWRSQPIALRVLRAFLGVTFVYAGIQKFADPNFLHSGTPDYIGNQLQAFCERQPDRLVAAVAGARPRCGGCRDRPARDRGRAGNAARRGALRGGDRRVPHQRHAVPVRDVARASLLPGLGLDVRDRVARVRRRDVGGRTARPWSPGAGAGSSGGGLAVRPQPAADAPRRHGRRGHAPVGGDRTLRHGATRRVGRVRGRVHADDPSPRRNPGARRITTMQRERRLITRRRITRSTRRRARAAIPRRARAPIPRRARPQPARRRRAGPSPRSTACR